MNFYTSIYLKKLNLKLDFIAVRGYIKGEWIEIQDKYSDLIITGKAIYDLDLLVDTFKEHIQSTTDSRFSILLG